MRTIFSSAVCLAAFLFLSQVSGAAEAEQSASLSWIEAVYIAQKNHPDILSAEEALNQAAADKTIARSGLFPQITASESSTTSQIEHSKSSKTHALSLSASQLVFDGSKTHADLRASLEKIRAAEYALAVASSDVRRNLRIAFVQLLRTQELVGLTEDIARRRRQNVDLVNLRYEAGREHRGALLTADADLASAEFEVAQAGRALAQAQTRLNSRLGEGTYKPVRAQGGFELSGNFEGKPDMEQLADQTPFLKQLAAKMEASRWGITSVQADYYPQVYADASAGRSDAHFLPETDRWSAGVRVSLPLFEGGVRKAQVEKSSAAFRQSQADLRSGRDSVILTLEDSWNALKNAQENVAVQKKYLDAAQERAQIAAAQYSNGLITFNDWTIIEDNLVRNRKLYLETQAAALLAEADWIQAKGGTLDYEE